MITGANGQLGTTFVSHLAERVAGAFGRRDLDIADEAAVRQAVEETRPDVIINCAAYNDVDGAERDEASALRTNAHGVRTLAHAARAARATFVHYSTDFVFDGLGDRPYVETDPTAPLSAYGRSKLQGEHYAAEAPGAYVLRVESLFGGPQARSSIDRMMDTMRAGKASRVFADRTVTPSYVDDVVLATESLLARGAAPGVYHCVSGGTTTWLGVAEELARILGSDTEIVPVKVADVLLPARRPQYLCPVERQARGAWHRAVALAGCDSALRCAPGDGRHACRRLTIRFIRERRTRSAPNTSGASSRAGRLACFQVQAERAAMEGFERGVGRVPAASPADVHRPRLRQIHRPPAGLLEPAAEVRVLPVQEKSFVHAADGIERLTARHQTGPRHPVDVNRLGPVVAPRQVVLRKRVAGKHARQPGAAAGDARREVRKAPCRGLNGPVRVVNAGTDGADVGVCPHPRREPRARGRLDDAVGVEEQQKRTRRLACAAVHAGGESLVAVRAQQTDLRIVAAERVGFTRVRRMVDDDDRRTVERALEGCQAVAQLVVALIVDDDDRRRRRVLRRETHGLK